MAAKTILCTLGPASLRADVLKELDARGIDLFRINLSHTPPDAVESTIEFVRRHSSTPICIDTEGAQVRCGVMMPGVVMTKGQTIKLTSTDTVGMADTLAVRPAFGPRGAPGREHPQGRLRWRRAPSNKDRRRRSRGDRDRWRSCGLEQGGDHRSSAATAAVHRSRRQRDPAVRPSRDSALRAVVHERCGGRRALPRRGAAGLPRNRED